MYTTMKLLAFSVLAFVISTTWANSGNVQEVGVGTRAFSMANNYVALSQDQSAVYWNPGALAFLPVREVQVSVDMLANHSETDFYGQQAISDMRRLRVPYLGFMTSVPTSQGGLTFAVAFQNPYIFDYSRLYSLKYRNNNLDMISSQNNIRTYGNLNFYTGSMGIQVAPGVGVGASLSLVAGTERYTYTYSETINDTAPYNEEDQRTCSYIGYDARLGVMYAVDKTYRLGARFVFPSTINFRDRSNLTINDYSESGTNTGLLQSSYSGAIGASAMYSFLTATAELRIRAPYDYVMPDQQIQDNSLAHNLNKGVGLGVEVPLGKSGTFFRCGYSFDQFDMYTFAKKAKVVLTDGKDTTKWNWDNEGVSVLKDKQLISGGFGYASKSFCIEAGYGMQFWKLNTNGTLDENYDFSRFSLSMSFRY